MSVINNNIRIKSEIRFATTQHIYINYIFYFISSIKFNLHILFILDCPYILINTFYLYIFPDKLINETQDCLF